MPEIKDIEITGTIPFLRQKVAMIHNYKKTTTKLLQVHHELEWLCLDMIRQ